MKTPARDLVTEYVLDLLPAEERKEIETTIASSPELRVEVRASERALTALTDLLPALSPAPGARSRLMATLAGPDRFKAFFSVLRRWFDLDDGGIAKVLTEVDGTSKWIDAPFPGVTYFHFQGGPAALAKESGCLRLSGGAKFPQHLHHGAERAMVLEGTLLQGGRTWHAGDIVEAAAASSHEFAAAPGRDLVIIVGHDGITFSA